MTKIHSERRALDREGGAVFYIPVPFAAAVMGIELEPPDAEWELEDLCVGGRSELTRPGAPIPLEVIAAPLLLVPEGETVTVRVRCGLRPGLRPLVVQAALELEALPAARPYVSPELIQRPELEAAAGGRVLQFPNEERSPEGRTLDALQRALEGFPDARCVLLVLTDGGHLQGTNVPNGAAAWELLQAAIRNLEHENSEEAATCSWERGELLELLRAAHAKWIAHLNAEHPNDADSET